MEKLSITYSNAPKIESCYTFFYITPPHKNSSEFYSLKFTVFRLYKRDLKFIVRKN